MALPTELIDKSINEIKKALIQQASTGLPATAVILTDTNAVHQRKTMLLNNINFASGTTGIANFTQAEAITRYRFKPSADMRATEDAANVLQAEVWLNTGAADTASTTANLNHFVVPANTWSEWQEFPEGYALSNVYFSRDSGTGVATISLEAE